MNDFVVLTNRKRAIIALVHSVVFLLIALYGLVTASRSAGLLSHPRSTPVLLTFAVYAAVTTILLLLVRISGRAQEKLYFSFCATSAGVGLLRSILGDAALHVGPQVRVLMLLCAVLTGALICRTHAEVPVME